MEEAFFRFEVEVVKLGDFEDVMYCALMVGHICTGGDSNVVHVNSDSRTERFVFEDGVVVNIVHHCLERCWRIGESEIHDRRFEKSISGFKRCLLFISFANTYVIIPPSNVKFCVYVCVAEITDKIHNQGKGILISNGEGIDFSVVLYRS